MSFLRPRVSVTPAALGNPVVWPEPQLASAFQTRWTGTMRTSGAAGTVLPYLGSDFVGNGTWGTAGTWLGVNFPAGFSGKIFDHRINNGQVAELTALGMNIWAEGLSVWSGGARQANFSTYHLKLHSTYPIQWTNGSYTGEVDTGLYRDSQGVLKVVGGNGSFGAGLGFFCDEFRRKGAGSPEGVVTAPAGATYHRSDGGAGTSIYVKESGSGNTGWVAK